jgi:hypothetical protein
MTTPPADDPAVAAAMNAWLRGGPAARYTGRAADPPADDPPSRPVPSIDVGNYPAPPAPPDMNAMIRAAFGGRY